MSAKQLPFCFGLKVLRVKTLGEMGPKSGNDIYDVCYHNITCISSIYIPLGIKYSQGLTEHCHFKKMKIYVIYNLIADP